MEVHFEGHFSGYDQSQLFYRLWKASTPKAIFIVTHGMGEHSGSYALSAKKWVEQGFDVWAWDMRGHGQSDGQRGYVQRIDEYEKDLHQFIKMVQQQSSQKGLPYVVIGHSLGGLVTLKNLISFGEQNLSAVMLSSPALGLTLEVPELKKKAAIWTSQWLPRLTLSNEIDNRQLTHDPQFLKLFDQDPLRHTKISPRLFLGMLSSFESLPQFAGEIQLPLLMQVSKDDSVVDSSAAQHFFDRLGSKRKKFIAYSRSQHEIYNDQEREVVFKDQFQFLKEILNFE